MFDKAFELLMINEGGFVNDADDSGGETKYGISQASYPKVNIAELTEDDAKEIYKKDFWDLQQCDAFAWPVALVYFDCIVNHGPSIATHWLQQVTGAVADGILGKKTIAAVNAIDPLHVARDLTLARGDFVQTLHNYDKFKNGWHKRHLDTLIAGVEFVPEEKAGE